MKRTICLFLLLFPVACAPGTLDRGARDEMLRASVTVYDDTEPSVATAVIIGKSETGLYIAITAAHAVECEKHHRLYVSWDRQTRYEARILKCDTKLDLALIEMARGEGSGIAPICETSPKTFDQVWAVGAGRGLPLFAVTGIVGNEAFRDEKMLGDTWTYVQHSAQITPGFSGGGLFKTEGSYFCLGGINLMILAAPDKNDEPVPIYGYSFAIHLDHIKEFIARKE